MSLFAASFEKAEQTLMRTLSCQQRWLFADILFWIGYSLTFGLSDQPLNGFLRLVN